MSPSDDVTTAMGTCESYDRLLTLKNRRQNRQHQHQQQQHQQQHYQTQQDYTVEENTKANECYSKGESEEDTTQTLRKKPAKYFGDSLWSSGPRHKLLMTSLVLVILLGQVAVSTAEGTMRFVVEPENKTVAEGWTVVFNCTVENRKGQVTWTQAGFSMGSGRELGPFPRHSMLGAEHGSRGEFNLQIRDVELTDEGPYECQVTPSENSRGLRSRKAYLTVVVPPERPVILNGSTIAVVLNRPSRLLCAANGGKPAPSINWYVDGERITENVSVIPRPWEKVEGEVRINATGVLILTATSAHTGKQIECQAYSQFMNAPYRTFSMLDVQYPPNVTMSLNVSSRTLREYDFVRFQCSAMANPPVQSWQWYNNSRPIQGATIQTYVIPAIGPEYNNAVISCEATNRVGSTRVDRTLNVEYGPRITRITRVVGADVGYSASLECEVDGNPSPSIIWRRKDLSRKSHRMLSTKNTYKIDHVTVSSFGWYVCTGVVIGFPDTSKEAMLLKNDRPNPKSEKKQMAVKGERGVLECLVHSIPKPKSIRWFKAQREIKPTLSDRFTNHTEEMLYGMKYTLIIHSVQSSDFGFYNCTVENHYGMSFDEIELAEKYTVPITYIIIGIIGGFAIIFVIVLVCVLYRRYRRDDQGSVLDNPDTAKTGSYTDTDSSSDKKREKADSPSTLMGQFRQGYGKDTYRFSADYDDVPYKNAKEDGQRKEAQSLLSWATCRKWRQEQTKGNNNGYGFIEPYESYSDHPIYDGEYVHAGDEPIPSDRFDSLYSTGTGGPGFNMSSFRGNNYDTTPPPTMTRITPIHMNSSKLATDV